VFFLVAVWETILGRYDQTVFRKSNKVVQENLHEEHTLQQFFLHQSHVGLHAIGCDSSCNNYANSGSQCVIKTDWLGKKCPIWKSYRLATHNVVSILLFCLPVTQVRRPQKQNVSF
jgi:hypothetical protein